MISEGGVALIEAEAELEPLGHRCPLFVNVGRKVA